MNPQYFVVSTGRTGTHFIAHYLNRSGLRTAVHQPEPDPAEMPIHCTTRDLADGVARGTYDDAAAGRWLAARRVEAEVEVNPFLYALIPAVRAVYPDRKYVYIARDPWGFCQSAYRFWMAPAGPFTKPVQFYVDERHERRLCAPEVAGGDAYAERWPTLSRAEKIAWFWRIKNQILVRALPPGTLYLRFEELTKPPFEGMRRLLEFLDVPAAVDPQLMTERQSASPPEAARIPEEERPRLLEIALDWDWQTSPTLAELFAPYVAAAATPAGSA